MGCCGSTRANLAHAFGAPALRPAPARTVTGEATLRDLPAARAAGTPVLLRYLGGTPISVRGPATGRRYAFSGVNAVAGVDGRDARVLLRTDWFCPA